MYIKYVQVHIYIYVGIIYYSQGLYKVVRDFQCIEVFGSKLLKDTKQSKQTKNEQNKINNAIKRQPKYTKWLSCE